MLSPTFDAGYGPRAICKRRGMDSTSQKSPRLHSLIVWPATPREIAKLKLRLSLSGAIPARRTPTKMSAEWLGLGSASRVAIQHDELSRRRYRELRKRGHSHGRALRTVADRLLAMSRTRTLFEPVGAGVLKEAA
jgi:hypothetical protein